MMNFFSKYRGIFYFTNLFLVILYIFPGSLLGCVFIDDCDTQPQITPGFSIMSLNHVYAFAFISIVGFLTFKKNEIDYLIIYLLSLSIILEFTHLIIPIRNFQWEDILGNLLGVIIITIFYKIIGKYGKLKK